MDIYQDYIETGEDIIRIIKS